MAAVLFSRPFFLVYRTLWNLLLPFLKRRPRLADGWRERLIPEDWLHQPSSPCSGRPIDIWIQASSGGEARLALAICQKFNADLPMRVLITTWTRQGRDIIEKAIPTLQSTHPCLSILVRFAPLDHPDIARKAVSMASPRVMVLLETELWPSLLAGCREKHIPVHVFNGRITKSTIRFGKMFSSLMKEISPLSIHAVSSHDQSGFQSIFPCTVGIMPNIKFDLAAQNLESHLSDQVFLSGTRGPVFLFASVRECEEVRIPGQLKRIYQSVPHAAVIIVPRHLHRTESWKSVLEDLGFSVALASDLLPNQPLPRKHILIWNRFGDLPHLYAAAGAVFVGGSFGQGGQNFLEALSAGCVPCIGPSASNFLWAITSESRALPSLEATSLLRIAHTPKEVIDIMLDEAAHVSDRAAIREKFQNWLAPRLGGALFTARHIEKDAQFFNS
ncbi:MAG: 3-deoxy-D-manno-octulosonic acid transferase [Mailhella sp.]